MNSNPAATMSESKTDLDYLRSLPLYKLRDEIRYWKRPALQGVAQELGLPIRYDDNHVKPQAVLTAAVYEEIRKR